MSSAATPGKPVYNVKYPCSARVAVAHDISAADAPKQTRHYELDLGDSGLEYLPGDSLAVQPQNDPELVAQVLQAQGWSGEEVVTHPKTAAPAPLAQALLEGCLITSAEPKLLEAIVRKSGEGHPHAALLLPENKAALQQHLYGRDTLDLLQEHPALRLEPQEFISLLKKLNIRLYSISSSQRENPRSVHLTIATVRYQSHGRSRSGVCSTFLAERIEVGRSVVPVFVNSGKGFRLPEPDEETPIIMVGPGTGIAPFRAFLQERRATAARGRAWLSFGEVSERSCFFYREEFEQHLRDGSLHQLTTAWSRDQAQKIYVQHRMLEQGAQLWQWLQQGAIVYVCGDASRMAADVDAALHQIVAQHGGMDAESAAAWMQNLRDAKRYRRDVY